MSWHAWKLQVVEEHNLKIMSYLRGVYEFDRCETRRKLAKELLLEMESIASLKPAQTTERKYPTGGDPQDFCACSHHEMNHANYADMPRVCNQTGCDCKKYTPETTSTML